MSGNKPGIFQSLSNLYNHEFKWGLIKSTAMFLVGVKIAQECVGLELMPSHA